MRKLIVFATVLVAAVAFTVPGAFGGAEQTGITAKSVVVGGTFPLTGAAAAYAPIPVGMRAYFSYINSRRGPDGKRGIGGRQVVWKIYDDGYNPANTIQFTRRLVEEDKVFATVGQLGTEHNLAVRPYMNQRRVPQSLVSTGASNWGTQGKEYPWTTGWQPDYVSEARIYGLHIKANHNGKKIAVLYQNDDYGKDYLLGLRVALGKKYADENVIASEAFDVTSPTVQAQMARIRASGARVFVILATPTFTIQAYAFGKALGYNPDQIYVNSVSATAAFLNIAVQRAGAEYVNGSLSVTYLKDPSNPRAGERPGDPGVQAAHGEVRPGRECLEPAVPVRVREGGDVRPGHVRGGEEPDAGELPGRPSEHEGDEEPVPAQRRRPEDERQGSVHDQPAAAPAVRGRHVEPHRKPRRGPAALAATRSTLRRGRACPAPTAFAPRYSAQ